MRTTDILLLALLGLALYGALDPAAASDLVTDLARHAWALLPSFVTR